MSIERVVFIVCDECQSVANADNGHSTVRSALDEAKHQGWKRIRGHDICNYCLAEGKPPCTRCGGKGWVPFHGGEIPCRTCEPVTQEGKP